MVRRENAFQGRICGARTQEDGLAKDQYNGRREKFQAGFLRTVTEFSVTILAFS